jgi:hypothetical protein
LNYNLNDLINKNKDAMRHQDESELIGSAHETSGVEPFNK